MFKFPFLCKDIFKIDPLLDLAQLSVCVCVCILLCVCVCVLKFYPSYV